MVHECQKIMVTDPNIKILSATLLLRGTLTWCSKFYLLNKLPARGHGHNYQNRLKIKKNYEFLVVRINNIIYYVYALNLEK